MKTLFILTLFTGLFLTNSCSNSSKESTGYKCPMECEGKKIHEKPGQCSVCEMDLEKI